MTSTKILTAVSELNSTSPYLNTYQLTRARGKLLIEMTLTGEEPARRSHPRPEFALALTITLPVHQPP